MLQNCKIGEYTMPKYRVKIGYYTYCECEVEAKDKDDAIEEATEIDCEDQILKNIQQYGDIEVEEISKT